MTYDDDTALGLFPPLPNDVLAYWRWYFETIKWPAAPKVFRKFWGLVDSCPGLQFLREPGVYEARSSHMLIYHLGEMWDRERWPRPKRIHPGVPGRPKEIRSDDPFEDFGLSLVILDLIVSNVLGPAEEKRRQPAHWKLSVDLVHHFLPEKFPAGWNREHLRSRVNIFLRKHRSSAHKGFLELTEQVVYLTSDEYRRTIRAHLRAHPSP